MASPFYLKRKVVYVLRGLPGTGKTTTANILIKRSMHDGLVTSYLSRDELRSKEKEQRGIDTWTFNQDDELFISYKFDHDLGQAIMNPQIDIIIIDNTNLTEQRISEIARLVKMGYFDWKVVLITFGDAASKSREKEPNFSTEIVNRMRKQMEGFDFRKAKDCFFPLNCIAYNTEPGYEREWEDETILYDPDDDFEGIDIASVYDEHADWLMEGYEIPETKSDRDFIV